MKKETLEEAVVKYLRTLKGINYKSIYDFSNQQTLAFMYGAKWQQERSYSEEDMKSFADWCRNGLLNTEYSVDRLTQHLEQWKQFKKK